jgi:hypothetical protein
MQLIYMICLLEVSIFLIYDMREKRGSKAI